MKLTSKELIAEFERHPFHSQAGKGGNAQVICKFALPSNAWVYYVLEAERMHIDEYEAAAIGLKEGDTWALRGLVFNVQHPRGEYELHILAAFEQTKVFTKMPDGEIIEERAERVKEFVPCRLEDVVEDMTALTAGKWCEDLLTPPTAYEMYKAILGQIEPQTTGA